MEQSQAECFENSYSTRTRMRIDLQIQMGVKIKFIFKKKINRVFFPSNISLHFENRSKVQFEVKNTAFG